jgi:hypothetical protein
LILLGCIIFVALGTFYWSLWEIPEIPFLSHATSGEATTDYLEGEEVDAADEQSTLVNKRPATVQCKDLIRFQPKKNFCRWDVSLESCYHMLMPVLYEKPSWIFLGDEGMAKVAYYISLRWPFESLNITSNRHSCENLDYYKLPPLRGPWNPPDANKGEGPAGYGKEHPYCTDSQKNWNVKMDVPTSQTQYVEYLVVEYARDVTLPTRVTKTTQETASYYLSTKNPAVCVVSAGLHDASIDPAISIDMYIQNVDTYLTHLTRVCQRVLWIGIPAVVESEGYPQRNCQLMEWNNAIFGLIDLRDGYDGRVYAMDLWGKSMNTDHVESLLLTRTFYASLARLFVTLMAGPDMTQRRALKGNPWDKVAAETFFPSQI